MSSSFYRAFEDHFRGSREEISRRLQVYSPLLASFAGVFPAAPAVDLGCGRGEWLDMLISHGFAGRGIDLDGGMLSACRERSLPVEQADALTYLSSVPNNSLALVSAFHWIEHIDFVDVRHVLEESLRVLMPGGLLVLETPNPENFAVSSCSFHLDPTHRKPLPPALMEFLVSHTGFARQQLMRLQQDESIGDDQTIRLWQVLAGTSADIAVVAQKQGPEALMLQTAHHFTGNSGASVQEIAERYHAQREQHAALREAQYHASFEHLLAELKQVQQLADAAHHGLQQVLHSKSWRWTAPIRQFMQWLRAKRHPHDE